MSIEDRLLKLTEQLADFSEAFDQSYYKRKYDLADDVNALEHYLVEGALLGNEPNFLFLSAYYGEKIGIRFSTAETPLEHFLSVGLASGISPHPLFDAAYYSTQIGAKSKGGPLYKHFLQEGEKRGLSPSPLFDVAWYKRTYSYFESENTSPFRHYVVSGSVSDNNPSELFNARWYKSMYGLPTVAPDSLSEFIWKGHAQCHMPNPLFDTYFYLTQYVDVATTGRNALADYVLSGAKLGRFPNPLFDGKYYASHYLTSDDVAVNPLAHYLSIGAKKRFDPCGLFSTRFYLSQLSEPHKVPNPLQHYLWDGSTRGLNPHPAFNVEAYIKSVGHRRHSNPLIDYVIQKEEAVEKSQVAPAEADIFLARRLSAKGVWDDNWCAQEVVLTFIASKSAKVTFNLWATMSDQNVQIELNGTAIKTIDLPSEELKHVEIALPEPRKKAVVRLIFARAENLSATDDRKAAAVISEMDISYEKAVRTPNSVAVNVPARRVGLLADAIWSLRYARHKGLRQGAKKFAEIRYLRTASFEPEFYLSQNPYEGSIRMDPVRHYVLFGAEKNLDPDASFSTAYYLDAHEDVRRAGINPYYHYLKFGKSERRRSEPAGGFKKKVN